MDAFYELQNKNFTLTFVGRFISFLWKIFCCSKVCKFGFLHRANQLKDDAMEGRFLDIVQFFVNNKKNFLSFKILSRPGRFDS